MWAQQVYRAALSFRSTARRRRDRFYNAVPEPDMNLLKLYSHDEKKPQGQGIKEMLRAISLFLPPAFAAILVHHIQNSSATPFQSEWINKTGRVNGVVPRTPVVKASLHPHPLRAYQREFEEHVRRKLQLPCHVLHLERFTRKFEGVLHLTLKIVQHRYTEVGGTEPYLMAQIALVRTPVTAEQAAQGTRLGITEAEITGYADYFQRRWNNTSSRLIDLTSDEDKAAYAQWLQDGFYEKTLQNHAKAALQKLWPHASDPSSSTGKGHGKGKEDRGPQGTRRVKPRVL